MHYQWIGDRQLHHAILKSLNLEDNFKVEMFPDFNVAKCSDSKRAAEYLFPDHKVVFHEAHISLYISKFAFVFFHELAHSTSRYTNRWERIWANTSPIQVKDIVGLEERIADLSALIWNDTYNTEFKFKKKDLKEVFTENETKFSLPWQEVENAVFCMLKNKACPKVLIALKYYKKLIMDDKLSTIKEGIFNG